MTISSCRDWTRIAVIICCCSLPSIAACVSSRQEPRLQGSRVGTATLLPAATRTGDFLSGAEMRAREDLANGNVYDAIMRLRDGYLRARVPSEGEFKIAAPSVFVDGTFYGGPEVLRHVFVSVVEEIRFLRSDEAVMRYGREFRSGVILISTRKPQ